MKNNILKSISAHEHQNIIRWYRNSMALFAVMICACFVIEYKQWKEYVKIKSEKNEIEIKSKTFDVVMERKQKLKQEENDLYDKLALLTHYKHMSIADFLSHLNKLSHFKLHSITKHENSFIVTGNCLSTHDATQSIHYISKLPCVKQVKLSSLNPIELDNKTSLQLTLKGMLKSEETSRLN